MSNYRGIDKENMAYREIVERVSFIVGFHLVFAIKGHKIIRKVEETKDNHF